MKNSFQASGPDAYLAARRAELNEALCALNKQLKAASTADERAEIQRQIRAAKEQFKNHQAAAKRSLF
jgi:hypothetical protein